MYREQQALHRQWLEQQSSSLAGALCPVSRHDGLTRVSIPKIDLDVIVVEGTNHKALRLGPGHRSEEHTSELQSLGISYAVFCLKKKKYIPALVFDNASCALISSALRIEAQICRSAFAHRRTKSRAYRRHCAGTGPRLRAQILLA